MRIGIRHALCVATVVLAGIPATALAAGGVLGGGGSARPVGGGGGGVNAGGGGGGGGGKVQLSSGIGPISPFFGISGGARYADDGGHRTLAIRMKGLDAFAGAPLDLLIGNVELTQAVVSATGTIDLSLDSALGDVVPTITPFESLQWDQLSTISFIAGGTFHA